MRRTPKRPIPVTLPLMATLLMLAPAARAEVAVIAASRDNTLFEDPAGALSDGAGQYLFAGRTNLGGLRRAAVAFDIAGSLPAGATVDAVTLTLNVSMAPPGALPVAAGLHRLLADWGEGASDAPGPEGMGTPAAPGDATWLHTFYPTDLWAAAGGDFAPVASAVATVGGPGTVTWGSTPELVADVQDWLDVPAASFGWLILGEELAFQTARRFDSRESADPVLRPRLTVEFTPPPSTAVVEIPTLGSWGLLLMAALVAAAGARRLRRLPR